MPGILPMKVIKIGANAQTRIAQACDRCRSKKIRCDGIRPSCTQCVNVGFECKTSDKLSRRAFPRGYTESLEERVRALEGEVRELKELLDEKDEKIDMLSRIHSHSPQPKPKRESSSQFLPSPSDSDKTVTDNKDDIFKIVQSPSLVEDDENDAYFMGTSSSRLLVESFKNKLVEDGRPSSDFRVRAFIPSQLKSRSIMERRQSVVFHPPARLVSDQLVNIFFQEWAPLFPILHRPTFLALYEEYTANSGAMEDKLHLAQLNLVFAIAAQSSDLSLPDDIESFNGQWQVALDSFMMDSNIATLQCLLLAVIASLQAGDYARLLRMKALAVSLSQRLGLHQSQRRFTLGTLTVETRKKLFWSLYTLDCFTAAQLGLPRSLRDEDVQCEYPVDADDEYITEKGFLPTLPGEYTKVSSAIALFKASRVLAKVISQLYPASASHEISFRTILALSDELDEWSRTIPTHLHLQFVQDKPSTNIISSRSPIISLAYHYIRSLIYQPAVCAASAVGHWVGSAKVVLASCAKHVVQICQLLTERSMCFAFGLNKNELLVAAGFGLLFQNLNLEGGSTLMKENQRLTFVIANMLDKHPSRASVEFRRISTALAMQHVSKLQNEANRSKPATLSRHSSDGSLNDGVSSTQRHIRALMSRFSSNKPVPTEERRSTVPNTMQHMASQSRTSLSSVRSEPQTARSEPARSPDMMLNPPKIKHRPSSSSINPSTNLDFLPLGSMVTPPYPFTPNMDIKPNTLNPTNADWERLLGSLDNGQTNIYDGIYGGPGMDALADGACPPPADTSLVWSPNDWALSMTGSSNPSATVPQSVLSFSDESLTSQGEEFPDLTNCASNESYKGIWIPEMSPAADSFGITSLDGGFGL